MRNKFGTLRLRAVGRAIVVSLMLGLCLGTLVLSVAPQLHHWLHADATSAGHECVVTLVTKGHLLVGMVERAVFASTVVLALLLLDPVWNFSVVDYRISPSRAPPSILSSLR